MPPRGARRRRTPTEPRAGVVQPGARLPARDDDRRVRLATQVGVGLVLVATLALVTFVRLRLADLPLERDEGEYALAGRFILQGVPPYVLAYNMKFPGAYYAYAVLMAVFGQTPWGIRAGLLAVNLLTAGLLFALGRRIAGNLAAGLGASAFALLTLDRWARGIFAHATHFVVLPAVAALLVLRIAAETGRAWLFVASGALMGVAVIMKQQGLFLAIAIVVLALWTGKTAGRPEMWKRGLWTSAGLALAGAVLLGVLAVQGVLGAFWFWTFQYASAYVSQTPLSVGMSVFGLAWAHLTQAAGPLWYAGVAGLLLLVTTRWTTDSRMVLGVWFAAAALSVMPGFYFRPHYFIVAMPVVGILSGVAIASIDRSLARRIGPLAARVAAIGLFVVLAGIYVQREAGYLFRMQNVEVMRAVYEANPFLASPEIGRYLREHTTPAERIAVFGSEPQILFYADRTPATGYIYMYPLTEPQRYAQQMRQDLIRDVQAAPPAYVVLVDLGSSWVATMRPDTRLVTWANAFVSTCYDRVGVVNLDPVGPPVIRWDEDSRGVEPRRQSSVTVFRRQSEPCSAAALRYTPGP